MMGRVGKTTHLSPNLAQVTRNLFGLVSGYEERCFAGVSGVFAVLVIDVA